MSGNRAAVTARSLANTACSRRLDHLIYVVQPRSFISAYAGRKGELAMAEPPCTGLRLSILGTLSAEADAPDATGRRVLPLGPLKQRLLLAMLLCRPCTPVSLDLLTETLWDGEPPRTARKNIQVYVSALRGLLDSTGAGDRLVHRRPKNLPPLRALYLKNDQIGIVMKVESSTRSRSHHNSHKGPFCSFALEVLAKLRQ